MNFNDILSTYTALCDYVAQYRIKEWLPTFDFSVTPYDSGAAYTIEGQLMSIPLPDGDAGSGIEIAAEGQTVNSTNRSYETA